VERQLLFRSLFIDVTDTRVVITRKNKEIEWTEKNIKKGKEKRKESKERKMTYFVYLELPDSAVL
jgi:hypothetical protein